MGFSYEEKAELLALVASSPKWVERVNGAFGHLINITTPVNVGPLRWSSPGAPSWAVPLPSPLHTGKRVRFQWHVGRKEVYYEGYITDHYIDADDCSGSYGEHKYAIKPDASSGLTGCSCCVKYCTLLS